MPRLTQDRKVRFVVQARDTSPEPRRRRSTTILERGPTQPLSTFSNEPVSSAEPHQENQGKSSEATPSTTTGVAPASAGRLRARCNLAYSIIKHRHKAQMHPFQCMDVPDRIGQIHPCRSTRGPGPGHATIGSGRRGSARPPARGTGDSHRNPPQTMGPRAKRQVDLPDREQVDLPMHNRALPLPFNREHEPDFIGQNKFFRRPKSIASAIADRYTC